MWDEFGGKPYLEPDLQSQITGRTESGAVWNKDAKGILTATQEVEERLPFALLGFDSDNGGEFLNPHLWAYMRERKLAVEFTRSRPSGNRDPCRHRQKTIQTGSNRWRATVIFSSSAPSPRLSGEAHSTG